MLEKRIGLFLIFGLVGGGLLTYGILVRQGRLKHWWALPYYKAGQGPFVPMPGGLTLLFWAVAMLLPQRWAMLLVYIGLGFGALALVFVIIQPRFLKPAWLQWLEDNHKKNIALLRKEARETGISQWAKRVQTQADLEQWVKEVQRKHGLIS